MHRKLKGLIINVLKKTNQDAMTDMTVLSMQYSYENLTIDYS